MFIRTLNYSLVDRWTINVILITSIGWILKRVFAIIKYLYHYSKFPRDRDCSFIFGDLLKLQPDYWNTKLTTFQTHLTKFIIRTGSEHQEVDGLFVTWISWSPVVFLCDHKSIESVANKNLLTKPSFYKFIGLKDGLVSSHGDKWRSRRKMVEPFFVSKQQKLFMITIDQVFDTLINKELVKLISTEKTLSMADHIHSSTCDIIFKIGLDMPVESNKEDKLHLIRTIELAEAVTMRRIFNPFVWSDLVFLRTELGKKFFKKIQKAYDFMDSAISQNLDQNSNEMVKDTQTKSSPINFVGSLMGSSKGTIDLQGVTEELFTIITAGHETTATALNWTLFILGNRLEIQEKVHQEIVSIFSDSESVNDMEKINQCSYLDACLKESLRLYPPIPLIARDLEKDIDVNGYRCLKGSAIAFNIYSIHRDPRIYPNPSRYDPERFAAHNVTKIPRSAYIPFGVLPRNCVGYRFALIEMKIFLIHILRRFEVNSVKKLEEVSVILDFTLKPSSALDIILRKRKVD